ncbi:MAG TPA: cyclase family protein [Phycisphaerae bacterium]|nr:cyclase family protein [Phycisphaerae bacterium]
MSEWIDISRPLRPGMLHWPGDRGFELRVVERIGGPGACNLSEIHTSAHIGTHVDAPRHVIEGGQDVAALPLGRLCGPATLIELAAEGGIAAADLARAGIPRGDRVLIRTANSRLWDLPRFSEQYVFLAEEAGRWLVDREVPLVGIDYLSVDRYEAADHPVHRLLLGAGVVVLEGLALDGVGPGRYELVTLPLKIEGGDGAPARVVLRPWGD